MYGKQASRRHRAERVAGQAWDQLTAAVDNAGASTRSASRRAHHLFGDASDRVEAGAKEAQKRANAAFDALTGRRPRPRWGLVAVAALAGAAVGSVLAALARQLTPHRYRPVDELEAFPEDVSSGLLSR